jgi:hypothetical protein
MAVNAQSKAPSNIDTPNTAWAVLFYDDNQRRWGFKKDDGSVKYFSEVGDETLTSLNLNSNTLTYTDEAGNNTDIDLSIYLDDTNLARLVNGTLDANTGIATFSRDDGTSFTVDFSSLIDIETITTLVESPAGVFTYTSEDASTTVINISSFESSTQLDARDSANRNRANHTGTQPASTISDFDTEVSNNVDVSANTAKVSADGSINTHSNIDLTGLADNDILVYDSISSTFKPEAQGASIDHGALTGLTDDDHSQYLLVDGTRSMAGDLDMGTNEIKLDETKKIIFDSNGTSTQFIQADTFFGIDIFRFKSAGVFNFDITSNIYQGRYDFQLGTNNNGQYLRIRNDSGTTLFQFYGDGTSAGLPFTHNGSGANLAGAGAVKPIAFGDSNGTGGLTLLENCKLTAVGAATNLIGTAGSFKIQYKISTSTGDGDVAGWTDAVTVDASTVNKYSNTNTSLSVNINAGERIEFQQINGNPAFNPTAAEVTVTARFITNG